MQRVESCHLFAVLHAPREGCRELSLVICLFSCQSMHMSKQRMCKEECKKRTLVIPCSVKMLSLKNHDPGCLAKNGGVRVSRKKPPNFAKTNVFLRQPGLSHSLEEFLGNIFCLFHHFSTKNKYVHFKENKNIPKSKHLSSKCSVKKLNCDYIKLI